MSYRFNDDYHYEQEIYGSSDVPHTRLNNSASSYHPVSWHDGDDQFQTYTRPQRVTSHTSDGALSRSLLPEAPQYSPHMEYPRTDQAPLPYRALDPITPAHRKAIQRPSMSDYSVDRTMLEVAPLQLRPSPPAFLSQDPWKPERKPSVEAPAGSINLESYPASRSSIQTSKLNSRVGFGPVSYEDDAMLTRRHDTTRYEGSESLNNTDFSKPVKQPLRKMQKVHRNFFHPRAKYSWTAPRSYQPAGQSFPTGVRWKHRDAMRRVWNGLEDDRYLDPKDGKINSVVVQTSDNVYDGSLNSTWKRTYVRNVSSTIVRVAQWPFKKVPKEKEKWTKQEWTVVGLWWLPTCISLLLVMALPADAGGQIRNNGFYDPFPYKYWGYARVARNFREDATPRLLEARGISERILRPRYLCFLEYPEDTNSLHRAKRVLVEEWLAEHSAAAEINYLFMSYTGLQFSKTSEDDMNALREIADKATRDFGLQAYWIDLDCMPDENELEDDVHRISDVVRGAHTLAIAVGPRAEDEERGGTTHEYLKVWGERMWTWPEVLLAPTGSEILVYTRGANLNKPLKVDKRNFPALVWDDAPIARQLMDHYEGTLGLSRLELVVLGLQCLKNRSGGTKKYCDGDLSYALMGLLRQRPKVDQGDSAFQAFARLSLANDSDMLLERLICVLPKDPKGDWSAMDDSWDVKLWDIYPSSQIAGIGEDDTVLIDGAFGAAIRWDSFAKVATTTRETWTRLISRILVRGTPLWFFNGILLVSVGGGSTKAAGAIFLVMALITILLSPILITHIYSGKLWSTQPWLFGFEGYLDLETIECKVFGFAQDRLSWSPFGSPLSRHREVGGECEGQDPVATDPAIRALVDRAETNNFYPEPKVFTLVDTNTMTVTMIEAARPPVMALLCGSEGGMQRAVLCSYDWKGQTLFRESVVRMETRVLEKMSRVGKVRFGMRRAGGATRMAEV